MNISPIIINELKFLELRSTRLSLSSFFIHHQQKITPDIYNQIENAVLKKDIDELRFIEDKLRELVIPCFVVALLLLILQLI